MAVPFVPETVKRYEKICFLGNGQFSTVYKARNRETGLIVAMKKIKAKRTDELEDGVSMSATREIKVLRQIKHPNVIELLDVFRYKFRISLIFELMETDLEVIIKDKNIVLSQSHIKAYMIMTLKGLDCLHMNCILHRDLKPNNLLISDQGVLKIGDFGLARSFGSSSEIYTDQVGTRYYRAPELLFGARSYGTGIDIWSVGCILAELLLRVPFLPGKSDLDQLCKIFEKLGTPTEENWPNVSALPCFFPFEPCAPVPLETIFTAANNDLLELIGRMLALDPLKRCTCKDALMSQFFNNPPFPTPCSYLPKRPLVPSARSDRNSGLSTLERILGKSNPGVENLPLTFNS